MMVWGRATQQCKDFNAGIFRLVGATAGYVVSRASGEISPMSQSKLWLLLKRLDEMWAWTRFLVTLRHGCHQAGLPLFDAKRRTLADLAGEC